MTINIEDQQLIIALDEKITAMRREKCSDDDILIASLMTLPHLQMLLDGAEPKELDLYLVSYPGFQYLVQLIGHVEAHGGTVVSS